MRPRTRPLWQCPKCRRRFANRNQSHACGRHDLEHHFAGKSPEIRALFDQVVAAIRAIGPVRILPEKTRIAFQVRMSFAQLYSQVALAGWSRRPGTQIGASTISTGSDHLTP